MLLFTPFNTHTHTHARARTHTHTHIRACARALLAGIFQILDEQTKVPNSDDKSTIIKMHQQLSGNPSYDNIRNSPIAFAISHYAGKVT